MDFDEPYQSIDKQNLDKQSIKKQSPGKQDLDKQSPGNQGPGNQGIDRQLTTVALQQQRIELVQPIRLTGQYKSDELSRLFAMELAEGRQNRCVIGVDEAGRGPLLGSVVVAAVILPPSWSDELESQPLKDTPLAILNDSKKLSEKKRDCLYPKIKEEALAYVMADVPAKVIDQVNIFQATMLGMKLCSEALLCAIAEAKKTKNKLVNTVQAVSEQTSDNIEAEKDALVTVLVDGNRCPELSLNAWAAAGMSTDAVDCQAWIKGDGRHSSIAAASVIAKVSRDLQMLEMAKAYPEYAIDKHKGYPTKAHLSAIEKLGVLPEHRRSFAPIRKLVES